MEVHICVCKLDDLLTSLSGSLLFKQGIEHWIHFVFDVFNKCRPSFFEWTLDCLLEVRVSQCEDCLELAQFRFTPDNPLASLSLWIDHQWVAIGLCYHDCILNGQVV